MISDPLDSRVIGRGTEIRKPLIVVVNQNVVLVVARYWLPLMISLISKLDMYPAVLVHRPSVAPDLGPVKVHSGVWHLGSVIWKLLPYLAIPTMTLLAGTPAFVIMASAKFVSVIVSVILTWDLRRLALGQPSLHIRVSQCRNLWADRTGESGNAPKS